VCGVSMLRDADAGRVMVCGGMHACFCRAGNEGRGVVRDVCLRRVDVEVWGGRVRIGIPAKGGLGSKMRGKV
jgi:hypothetical protein